MPKELPQMVIQTTDTNEEQTICSVCDSTIASGNECWLMATPVCGDCFLAIENGEK